MTDPRSSPPSPETPPPTMLGYEIDGTETRSEVINGALYDVRAHSPRANVVQLGDAIEHYLRYWESKRVASPRSSLTAPTELKEALDRYFQTVVAYHRWREPDIVDSTARAIEMGEARGAVESLWASHEQEMERLSSANEMLGINLSDAWAELSSLRRERDELKKTVQNL